MSDKRRSRSARSFWLQNPLSRRRSSFEQLEDRLNIGSMMVMLPGGRMSQYLAQEAAAEAFRVNQDRLALEENAARPQQQAESPVSGIEFDASRFLAGGKGSTRSPARASHVVDPSHADWFGLPTADDDSQESDGKLIDREEQDRLLAEAEAADQPIFGGEILTLPPPRFPQPSLDAVSNHPNWSEYSTPPQMRSPLADRPSISTADNLPPIVPPSASASGEAGTMNVEPQVAANESAPADGTNTDTSTPAPSDTQTPTSADAKTLASFPLTSFSPMLDGWASSEFGGTNDPGTVNVEADNSAVLREGDSFVVSLTHTFEIPAVPSEISFEYADLNFDTADGAFINDAFEVALVDSDGYSLVGTTSAHRDVFFNITEGLSEELGDQATLETTANGQKITLDISDVPAGSEASLIFRLVNNDSDVNTSVRILSVGAPGLQSPPVVAEFEPIEAFEGDTVTLSTTFIDNDVEDVHSAFIDWGDGTTSLGTIVESDGAGSITAHHVYADNDTYEIQLEVFDNQENSDAVTGQAIIENVSPSLIANLDFDAAITTPDAPPELTALITGEFTDPGFDRPSAGTEESFVLTIDWGDGSVEEIPTSVVQGSEGVLTLGTFSATHPFGTPGVYDIVVTVTDDDEGTDSVSFRQAVVDVDIRPAIREPQYDPIYTWTLDTSLPHGLIPVIFEGNDAFDVTQIDVRTVLFQPGGAPEYNWQMLNYEVTGDGQVDAIAHFSTWQVELDTSDIVGFVSAELWDGTPMIGVDFLPFTPFSSQVPSPPESSEAAGTKFFVLDGTADATFRYAFDGSPLGGFETTNAVENPVGIAADSTGSTVWIVDGTTEMVHVHAADGSWLGAWQPRQLQQPEGIATDDTDVFIIDGNAKGILRYNGAAGLRSGYASPNAAFLLHTENASPTAITTDGTTIWVTDDVADTVFTYTVGGTYLGRFALDPANADASGITHDPAGTDTLWTTDRVDGVIYQYPGAASLLSGTAVAALTLPLADGNQHPEGIADPPPDGDESMPDPAAVPLAADLDGDGTVGSGDLDTIRFYWGQAVTPGSAEEGDATGDGVVDAGDLDIVRANWGQTGQGQATAENSGADAPVQTADGVSLLDENGEVIFDSSADFDVGELFNVNTTALDGAVQLNPAGEIQTYPFIWISNSGEGTISCFDTRTGEEIGRYRTGPESVGGGLSPSRICVTLEGDAWVANRGDNSSAPYNAVKILRDGFVDRNGNGVVDTCQDLNGDGSITGNEILPWDANGDGQPDDERIAMTIHAGRNRSNTDQWIYNGGARGIAVDTDGYLWVGLYSHHQYEVFDAGTGEFMKVVPVNGSPYGAAIGPDGILYSTTSNSRYLDRIDTATQTYLGPLDIGSTMYGITVDPQGVVWCSGYTANKLIRYDPSTGELNHYASANGRASGGGVAVDRDGNVWAAQHDGYNMLKWVFADDGKTLVEATTVQVGHPNVKAAALDADGYIWTTCRGDNTAHKIDPDTNQVVLSVQTGSDPYNYSDMTGSIRIASTQPTGNWTEIIDSLNPGQIWASFEATAVFDETTGNAEFSVRAAETIAALDSKSWQSVEDGDALHHLQGRYLEVKAQLRSSDPEELPLVEDIRIAAVTEPVITVFQPEDADIIEAGTTLVLSGNARPFKYSPSGEVQVPNRIIAVLVNGTAVDALDAGGNFFAQTTVQPGENTYEVTAIDAFGQRATETVKLFGTQGGDGTYEDLLFETSPSFRPDYARTSFDERTDRLYAQLGIENVGRFEADTPFYVGITHLSDPTVSIVDPVGVTSEGIPYYNLSAFVPGETLDPAEMTLHADVVFHNPNRERFEYELVFVYEVNEPPAFDSVPVLEGYLATDYTYDSHASDPDGDVVTYSLLTHPRGMEIGGETGAISWPGDYLALGNHEVVVQADDGRGGTAQQQFTIVVGEMPPNRPPVITSVPVTEAEVSTVFETESSVVDLSEWTAVQYEVGGTYGAPQANWILGSNNTSVRQTMNTDPAIFLSDFVLAEDRINGTWRVDESADDDWMGFVFGYQDTRHFYLFDWSQGGGNNSPRMRVLLIDASSEPPGVAFDPYSYTTTLFENSIGWSDYTDYGFSLEFHSGRFSITVREGSTILESLTLYDDTYTSGRFGFFNASQEHVVYSGFTKQDVPEYTYRYDVEATDPDFDPVEFSLQPTVSWTGPTSIHIENPGFEATVLNDGEWITNVAGWTVAGEGGIFNPTSNSYPGSVVTEGENVAFSNGATISQTLSTTLAADTEYTLQVDIGSRADTTFSGYSVELWAGGNMLARQTSPNPTSGTFITAALSYFADATDAALGQPLEVRLSAPGSQTHFDNVRFSSNSQTSIDVPGGMEIDPATGLILWGPTAEQLGYHTITVEATDPHGATDAQTFVVEVLPDPTNHPPVIVTAPVNTAVVGSEYQYNVDAVDADDDTLTYSIEADLDALTIDSVTGVVSLSATLEHLGVHPISVKVSDGRGGFDEQSFDLTIVGGTGSITGTVYDDQNRNGLRDSDLIQGDAPLLVFVVDSSGSMDWGYQGSEVGDPNGDGQANTRLDVAYLGLELLNQRLIDMGVGDTAQVALIDFSGSVRVNDMDPAAGGQQFITTPAADTDGDGTYDLLDAALTLFGHNDSTNYAIALNKAADVVASVGIPADGCRVIFLSDGEPYQGGSGTPEADNLRSMGVNIQAFGIGDVAFQSQLQAVDPDAYWFQNSDDFFDALAGLNSSVVTYLEPGIPGRTVYVDLNGDGHFNENEPFAITNEEGIYRIDGVPADYTHQVRNVVPLGWEQTQPWSEYYEIALSENELVRGKDFGNFLVDDSATGAPVFISDPLSTADVDALYLYKSIAVDPDNDALTYSLPVAPNGMTVHPELGIVVWQPTTDQTGPNQVVLKVSDGRGGVDIQSFFVDVAESNTAPVITTQSLPGQIQADSPFKVVIAAQDAEGDKITFSVTSDVAGANVPQIDENTGVLTWQPGAGQLGPVEITVTATDEPGDSTSISYTLEVVETLPNDPPVIESTPRVRTRMDLPYMYLVQASDPNGDPLTYALGPGAPTGMTFDTDGLLQWTPTSNDPTSNDITIIVSDGRGGQAMQVFTLAVVTEAENTAPRITSNPSLSTILGKTYQYAAEAFDAEDDPVLWSLAEAPHGMSIDALTGEIFWTPNSDQRGDNDVVVRVTDVYGASTTQSFTVNVRGVNRPPAILSAPPTEAFVDEAYIYAVRAQDPDGDKLTFSFANDLRPEGMTIDAATGLIEWPDLDKPTGVHAVSVLVQDSFGGIDVQTFSIEVTDANLNFSPVITSTPVYNATSQHDYAYTVTASDPENDPLMLALDAESLARGMAIDASGKITWSPGSADIGANLVTVTATDTAGNRATQTYTLSVRANQVPAINSQPVTSAAAGIGYAYDVWASDPEGDTLTYRLIQYPTGMEIDDLGRIRWQPGMDLMGTTHNVILVVSDSYGAESASQSFSITVTEDTTAPEVILAASTNMVNPGGSIRFQVRATDDVGIDNVVLLVDGVPHAVNPEGSLYAADLMFDQPGLIDVVAQATDLAGNEGQSDPWQVRVFDPSDQDYPVVTIEALIPQVYDDALGHIVDGERIEGDALHQTPTLTYLTDVEVSIADDNMGNWRIEYAPTSAVNTGNLGAADPDYKLLAEGTGVIDHERFTIDTTLLANDAYILRILAYDVNGNGWAEPLFFGVSGEAKLGNFAFTLNDFSVSLAGIPLQITRTYDTLTVNTQGDFGYGWTMAISDPNIGETTPAGYEMQDGDRVYLTNPEGKRVGFTYEPELVGHGGLFLAGIEYVPRFTPDPGVRDTLTVKEGSYMRGGVFGTIIGALDNPWNPSQYVLTTRDGTVYEYIQNDGLQEITDTNGNVVTFTDTAITHSAGGQIDLHRDTRGRITEIVDTAGNSIAYGYDALGNLKTFSNQIDSETGTPTYTYAYRDAPAHFLDTIYDSEGTQIFEATFDDDGRLTGATDALGNVTQQEFDPGAMNGTITDARGNVTTVWYDDGGNVTEEESAPVLNPLTGETVAYTKTYEYADPNHPDKETKVVEYDGTVVEHEYDADGNTTKTTRTSADGSQSISTGYDYDSDGNLTEFTAPGGSTSIFTYTRANATSVTTSLGNTANATYNAAGKQESFTDFNGNTTTYEYKDGCPCGTPKQVTHPDGTYELREWNRQALITKVEYYEADGTLAYVTTTDYDALGRKTQETVGAGADKVVTAYTYDGNTENVATETIVHPTDPSQNHVTHYFYDDAGNLIRQVDPDLDVSDPNAGIFFKYDASGNRVWLRDPVGNVTTWIYDSLNRVIEERDPLYWDELGTDWSGMTDAEILVLIKDPTPASSVPYGESHITRYAYDAAGNAVEEIDRNGHRRTFEYDFQGNLLKEIWHDEADDVTPIREMTFSYDTAGNMRTVVDPDAEYVFTYDTMNRLETMSVDYPWAEDFDTFTLTYTYDAMGNVLSTTDSTGVTVRSEYDGRNNLTSRWWEGVEVDNIRADFDYTAVGQLDQVERWANSARTASAGSTDFTYNLAGRTSQILHKNAADEVFAQYDYGFDFGGLLTQEILDHVTDDYDRKADYAYDSRGQLLSALYDNDQADESFSYDANGNRTMPGYATGAGNRLLSDGIFSYTYDAEGNMVSKARITPLNGDVNYTEFEYDLRNRTTKVTQYSSEDGIILHEQSYRYDGLGRRIQVVSDGERMITLHDGYNSWADYGIQGELIAQYLFANGIDDIVAGYQRDGGVVWQLKDQLGSIRDVVGGFPQVVIHIDYDSYGGIVGIQNLGLTTRFLFAGREFDFESRLYYFRTRMYTPSLGRFQIADTIDFDGKDFNLYRYAFNSPNRFTDPTGTTVFSSFAVQLRALVARAAILRCLGFAAFTGLAEGGIYILLTSYGATPAGPSNVYVGQAQRFVVRFYQHAQTGVGGRGLQVISQIPIRLSQSVLNNPQALRTAEQLVINAFGGKAKLLNIRNASRMLFCR